MKRFVVCCLLIVLFSATLFAGSNSMHGFVGAEFRASYTKTKYDSFDSEFEYKGYDIVLNGANYLFGLPFGIFYDFTLFEAPWSINKDGVTRNISSLDSYTLMELQDIRFGLSYKMRVNRKVFFVTNAGIDVRHRDIDLFEQDIEGYIFGATLEPLFLVSLEETNHVNLKVGCSAYLPLYCDEKFDGTSTDKIKGFGFTGSVGVSYVY